MAADNIRLQVLLSAVDKLTGPLKRVVQGSSATAAALKKLRDAHKALEAQQALINQFRNAHKASAALRAELAGQQAKIKQLAAEHKAAGPATAAMERAMQRAQGTAGTLKQRLAEQQQTLQRLRERMGAAGMATTGLANTERSLRADLDKTSKAIERQQQQLKALGTARHKAAKMGAKGAAMAAGGMGSVYGAHRAGVAAGGVMQQSRLTEAEALRIRALGLPQQDAQAVIEFAKRYKSYGTSTSDNMALMRDAVTVFNDVHHSKDALPFLARMKFANEAAFGAEHGAENDRKFMDMMKVIELRGGANNRVDFERNGNLVQKVITATGGRVGAEDWMQVIKRGGLAATGIDEKEFFLRLEPLVQSMGGAAVGTGMMSAYQNIYQGRTTKRAAQMIEQLGLIDDPTKVQHDKTGQVSFLGVGAVKGAEIFQRSQFEWLEKVLVPTLKEKGLTSDKEILDAIGAIFTNRSASNLMSKMYQLGEMVNKSYLLNTQADDVDTLNERAMASPQGKEIALQKRRDDLYQRMGSAVMPGYIKLLEVLTGVAEAAGKFAAQNPRTTAALGYLAAGMIGVVGAAGLVLVPLGLILAKGAILRFVLARLGINAGAMAASLTARLAPALHAVGGALLWLGRAGLAFLATPLGAALALLGTAAFLLWRNWDGVKGGLLIIWQQLSDAGARWWGSITSQADALWATLAAFPARMYQAGSNMMTGLVQGIMSRVQAVRDAISTAAGDAVDAFRARLGIHSPSRVFLALGGHVGEGAALGIERGAGLVRAAALGMAAASVVPMGAVAGAQAGGMAAMPAPARIAQPAAPALAGQGGMGGSAYTITINAAPGMDERALARAVAQELDKRERSLASRRYSRLSDID